jgi:hypothetical protein
LTLNEFTDMLSRISTMLGKPYYAARVRPKFVKWDLWQRLKEDINPRNRIRRLSLNPDFRKNILKAFGKYNVKGDGKLTKEDYHELCAKELRFTKQQANSLLESVGLNLSFKFLDIQQYCSMFIGPEQYVPDVRESDDSRRRCLDTYNMLHNYKLSTASISTDELKKSAEYIDAFQMNARLESRPESREIVKSGIHIFLVFDTQHTTIART